MFDKDCGFSFEMGTYSEQMNDIFYIQGHPGCFSEYIARNKQMEVRRLLWEVIIVVNVRDSGISIRERAVEMLSSQVPHLFFENLRCVVR